MRDRTVTVVVRWPQIVGLKLVRKVVPFGAFSETASEPSSGVAKV